MKTNAPEKIFLHPDIGGKEFIRPWLKKRASQESVEYTRTDAFVEKAAEWIKNKAENYIVETHLCSYFDYKRAVEDFRNYMEGE